jgi:hypothetical protein
MYLTSIHRHQLPIILDMHFEDTCIKSILKFENTKNVSFILYMNSPTNIKSNSKICLQI